MDISILSANGMLDTFRALFNSGSLDFYMGTKPTLTTDARTGIKVVRFSFAGTAFGAASAETITAAAIAAVTDVLATGTAGYWCGLKSDGTVVMQGPISDWTANTLSFVIHGSATITSLIITHPLS